MGSIGGITTLTSPSEGGEYIECGERRDQRKMGTFKKRNTSINAQLARGEWSKLGDGGRALSSMDEVGFGNHTKVKKKQKNER